VLPSARATLATRSEASAATKPTRRVVATPRAVEKRKTSRIEGPDDISSSSERHLAEPRSRGQQNRKRSTGPNGAQRYRNLFPRRSTRVMRVASPKRTRPDDRTTRPVARGKRLRVLRSIDLLVEGSDAIATASNRHERRSSIAIVSCSRPGCRGTARSKDGSDRKCSLPLDERNHRSWCGARVRRRRRFADSLPTFATCVSTRDRASA
jgi:hypothetical protein